MELRVAVTTGEALVTDGVRVAGDPVATCARLQQAAPSGTVLVSEATGRATERSISYGPASLLALAGRAKPMSVWSALEPRNRTGMDGLAAGPVPLIGRDRELGLLLEAFRRARDSRRPQLVTLLGPPGIGKSRLVAELGRALDADDDLVSWRQGRSSPWDEGRSSPTGGGVTYWALAEIVKAEAGILETDSADRVGRRLSRVVAHAMADDPDATDWVSWHLRGLVGEGDGAPVQPGRRDEAFTAWRRFLYGLAARRPLVLVLEDLHWADDALLDFLQELLEPTGQATLDRHGRPLRPRTPPAAPLLVVATARKELLARRPGWDGSGDAALAVELEPLSEADTGHLLETLLSAHRLPTGVGPALLAAAGGNPLFAEEYVRMVRDHHPLAGPHGRAAAPARDGPRHHRRPPGRPAGRGEGGAAGPLGAGPGRLGRRPGRGQRPGPGRGRGLPGAPAGQGVPVPGRARRPWPGSASTGSATCWSARSPTARSRGWSGPASTAGPPPGWSRWPPSARSCWPTTTAGPWSWPAPPARPPATWPDRARLALRDAGDRVTGLGAHPTAARYYSEALAIWPAGDPERPDLELRAGAAYCLSEGAGEDLLTSARDGLLAIGDRERAAEAEAHLGLLAYTQGRERSSHLDRALALVADLPPSHSKAVVLSHCMMHLLVADRNADAMQVAREGLAMARSLGDRNVEAVALGTIGATRVSLGDPGGLADLERCIAMCEAIGSSTVISWHGNLAFSFALLGDLRRCFSVREAAWEAAEQFGSARGLRWLELERAAECYWSGRWDQAVRVADLVAPDGEEGAQHYMECLCRLWRGRIRLARGQLAGAREDAGRALTLARESGDRLNLDPALAFKARVLLVSDQAAEAGKLLDELLATLGGGLLKPELGVDLAVDLVAAGPPGRGPGRGHAVALAGRGQGVRRRRPGPGGQALRRDRQPPRRGHRPPGRGPPAPPDPPGRGPHRARAGDRLLPRGRRHRLPRAGQGTAVRPDLTALKNRESFLSSPDSARRSLAAMVSARPRDRILTTATDLFHSEGIGAVGVNRIISQADVAPMTLYRQFGNKDNLVAAALEQWSTSWLHRLADAMDRRGDDPSDRFDGLWDELQAWFAEEPFRGSFVANAATELRSESHHPAQPRIAQHRQALRQLLEDLAKSAGAYDSTVLAAQLQILIDGAIASASVDRDPSSASGARALARAAVTAASAS